MPVIIDDPGEWNVLCYGGRTFDRTLTLTDENGDPVDLTGFTGSALVKDAYTDADASAVVTFTTTDSSMILGDALGTIRLLIDEADTAALQATYLNASHEFEWDGQLDDGTDSSPVWRGKFTLLPSATR